MKKLDVRNEEYMKENQKIKEELNILKSVANVCKKKLAVENEKLKKSLKELEEKNITQNHVQENTKHLERQITADQAKINELNIQKKECINENNKIKEELKTMKCSITDSRTVLAEENTELKIKIKSMEKHLEDCERERCAQSEKVNKLEREITADKKKINELDTQKEENTKIKDELKILKSEVKGNEKLVIENTKLKNTIKELEKRPQENDPTKANKRIKELEGKLAAEGRLVEKMRRECNQYSTEKENIQKKLNDFKRTAKEKEKSLHEENVELEAKMKINKTEERILTKAQENEHPRNEVEMALQELQVEMKEVQEKNKTLENLNAKTEKQILQRDQAHGHQVQRIKLLEESERKKTQELADKAKENKKLTDDLKSRIYDLEVEFSEELVNKETYESKMNEKCKTLEREKGNRREIERRYEELEKQIKNEVDLKQHEAVKMKLSESEKEKNEVEEELKEAYQKIEQMKNDWENEVYKLRIKLSNTQDDKDYGKGKLADSENKLNEQRKQMESFEDENIKMKLQLSNVQIEIDELKTSMEEKNKLIEKQKAELNELKLMGTNDNAIEEQNLYIQQLEDDFLAAKEMVDELHQAKVDMEDLLNKETGSLKRKLKKAEIYKENVQEELNEINQMNETLVIRMQKLEEENTRLAAGHTTAQSGASKCVKWVDQVTPINDVYLDDSSDEMIPRQNHNIYKMAEPKNELKRLPTSNVVHLPSVHERNSELKRLPTSNAMQLPSMNNGNVYKIEQLGVTQELKPLPGARNKGMFTPLSTQRLPPIGGGSTRLPPLQPIQRNNEKQRFF